MYFVLYVFCIVCILYCLYLQEGGHTWEPTLFIRLVQDLGVDTAVAQHLSATYGDRAFSVGKLAGLTGQRWPVVGKRIHPEFPYIDVSPQRHCPV